MAGNGINRGANGLAILDPTAINANEVATLLPVNHPLIIQPYAIQRACAVAGQDDATAIGQHAWPHNFAAHPLKDVAGKIESRPRRANGNFPATNADAAPSAATIAAGVGMDATTR